MIYDAIRQSPYFKKLLIDGVDAVLIEECWVNVCTAASEAIPTVLPFTLRQES